MFLVIEQEKDHQKLVQGIENFDTSNLKHAETLEKNPLPTKEGNFFFLRCNSYNLSQVTSVYFMD